MSDSPTQAELAELRSQSAWFLSRFYLERPEPAFLAEVAAALAAGASGEGQDKDVQLLITTLTAQHEPLSARLEVEFTRLLRGIQEGYGPPPPYEGLHRGGAAMDDCTLAVMHHYTNAGFADIAPEAGPPDHLATELRFLALLALREAEAHRAGENDVAQERMAQQTDFLDQHLLAWLPHFAARIEAEAQEPFYPAVARLTLAFVQEARGELELAS